MSTNAGLALTARFERQIVKTFRAQSALSGPSAQRLRDLGLKDSPALRALVTSQVLRKAGPERFFLDENVWAARRHAPLWYLMVVVGAVLVVVGLVELGRGALG